MFLYEVLIVEFSTVDTLSTGSIASCEITTLYHELLYHAMEAGALVGERLASFTNTLLTSAERSEVICGLGSDIIIQFENNSSLGIFPDGNVEENSTAGFGFCSRHCIGWVYVRLEEGYGGLDERKKCSEVLLWRTE